MSFDKTTITLEQHNAWFSEAILSKSRLIYIGEINEKKIGICRFDFNPNRSSATVSINIDPASRGKGIGKQFLIECVDIFLTLNAATLIANIRPENQASQKIFGAAGFKKLKENDQSIVLQRNLEKITFKQVSEKDSDILFKMLQQRKHQISHDFHTSRSQHLHFIKTNPYRYWALLIQDEKIVGAFYLQHDNSIGLNLIEPNRVQVARIFEHLKSKFRPAAEIKSIIPPYFYVNVAYNNQDLLRILTDLQLVPVQISLKLS